MPMHYLLEIGPGISPFPAVGKRGIAQDEHYIGVDSTQKDTFEKGRERLSKIEGCDRVHLARAGGCSLPFKDLSISEVVCCNVFGAPGVFEQIPGITAEVGRVLKVGGILTIVERYTPFNAPFNQMRNFLESKGFHLETNEQSVYDLEQIVQYTRRSLKVEPPKNIDAQPYFAQFMKLTHPLFSKKST